jgi:hypothetical protein
VLSCLRNEYPVFVFVKYTDPIKDTNNVVPETNNNIGYSENTSIPISWTLYFVTNSSELTNKSYINALQKNTFDGE